MSTLSASDILAIPLSKPHLLFPGDVDLANQRHKKLVSKWHPDRNKDVGSEVLSHINVLFERAIAAIEGGQWTGNALLKIKTRDGRSYQFRYEKMEAFELGRFFVSSRFVMYLIEPQFKDLAVNAVNAIKRLSYRDAVMRKEHERYMPALELATPVDDGKLLVLLRKQPDQFPLSDIKAYLGGSIEPKHVAWILSSLYNINCYLKWAGINHNDISPANYFVSPAQHNGALLGGWWYSARTNSKPLAVPARTHGAGRDFTTKAIDGSLIRMTGQELLGPLMGTAPKPMQLWLRGLGSKNSYDEYKGWADVLLQSFGPPRYAELKLPESIY